MSQIIEIEKPNEFATLSTQLEHFLQAENKSNIFQLFAYFIESLATRACLGLNELSCVHISLQMDSFINILIDKTQFVLAAYLMLEILFKNLIIQIDFIENNHLQSNKCKSEAKIVNEKLFENPFYLATFICNRIESSIRMFTHLLACIHQTNSKAYTELTRTLFNCTVSRIIYMLTTVLIRKIIRFDCYVKMNLLESFKAVMLQLSQLDEPEMLVKCNTALETFHFISLVPFYTLKNNYKVKLYFVFV